MRGVWKIAIVAIIFAVLIALFISVASAHQAPSRWNYPAECCSGRDCEPLPSDQIEETPTGYLIKPLGIIMQYSDPRIKPIAMDGLYHWCRQTEMLDGEWVYKRPNKIICLLTPASSF